MSYAAWLRLGLSGIGLAIGPAVSAYVIQEAPPWPDGTVTFELQMGSPPTPLIDGSTTWDQPVAAALEIWNQQLGRLRLVGVPASTAPIGQGNGRNNLFFSDRAYDRDFGERTLAITFSRWITGSRERRIESDIIFNRNEQWNSYRGPLRFNGNRSLAELRRVALHELGHALGLDHPNERGQTVTAVMNATVGNLDTVAPDDVAGGQALYGVPVQAGVPARLANLSVRSRAGAGERTLIVGFITAGGESALLMRGIGPTLTDFNVAEPLPDPRLTLYRQTAAQASNDNWGGSAALTQAFQQAGAFALTPSSRDAALLATLGNGVYSIHLTDAGGQQGVGLVEVYSRNVTGATGQLVNASARTHVGTGADVLILGFVIEGGGAARLLVRGIGPALADFGLAGYLADPELVVFRETAPIAQNDNWSTGGSAIVSAMQEVNAFALRSNSRDAALLVELAPGAYSAQVRGVNNGTGVGLVELYLLP